MYSEGVQAVQAVLRGKLTSRGVTGRARRIVAVPPCHTSGNACIAAGSWRYHRYPLSHPKSLRTW
jgi:hypothetical protein